AIGGAEGFAGGADVPGAHAFLGAFAEEQVHHLVRDAVSDLVRMTFRNAFGGKQIVGARHGRPLTRFSIGRAASPSGSPSLQGGPYLQALQGGSTGYVNFRISSAGLGGFRPKISENTKPSGHLNPSTKRVD